MKMNLPDKNGYYGNYGGRFVPETLVPALNELEAAYRNFQGDKAAQAELADLLANYAGRPTPVYFARRLSSKYKVNIYLKREDLLHTGAHKLNNALGQILLAKRMGKTRIIAETGAGQHGVATATCAALFGLEAVIYMGKVDMERQMPNVKRMRLLGSEVQPVEFGSRTLKDAINAAMQDWVKNVRTTHYLLGSALGPHPFPEIVRDFQSVIGMEAREQMERIYKLKPDYVVACVGGGSNAAGMFSHFKEDDDVKLIGVEAGGRSITPGNHSARFAGGRPGILHGSLTYLLQDDEGQVMPVHSVSAGLDYPAVGPEHVYLRELGRADYFYCSDNEALVACRELCQMEGIIPALESSHAVGYILANSSKYEGKNVLINLSGRGDKDMNIIERELGL